MMKPALFGLFLLAGACLGEADDFEMAGRLLVAAHESGEPWATGKGAANAAISAVRYVGVCEAPFGKVVIGEFHTTNTFNNRGAIGKLEFTYLAFFDAALHLRNCWPFDGAARARLDGTELFMSGKPVLNFARLPAERQIRIGETTYVVPRWKRAESQKGDLRGLPPAGPVF